MNPTFKLEVALETHGMLYVSNRSYPENAKAFTASKPDIGVKNCKTRDKMWIFRLPVLGTC